MSLDEKLMDVAQAYLSMHEKAKTEDASNDKSDDGDGMDKVDPKAAKKKFKDRKDKDIDNDGDTDGSDEYLHKRRKAIASKDDPKKEAVEIEVDDKSDASPEMDKKDDPKKKKKTDPKVSKAKDDDKGDADAATEQKESVDTSPAGDSPPAKRASVRDKEFMALHKDKKAAEKRRDEDRQDGTNAVKVAPTRPGDSKVGEKAIKTFKQMRK